MRMGVETEFAILGSDYRRPAEQIQKQVEQSHRHLRSTRSGVFLENGARVYIDQGPLNEYSTAEVEDPLSLVRSELAGRALMAAAAKRAGHVLLCSHVHFSTGYTSGHHENYEVQRPFEQPALVALESHLATRIIFSGGGGPHPRHLGVRVVLSPRACVTVSSSSRQGRSGKAMVYRKPDDCGPGHRLHVMSGESLLCPRASWLKYGSTALVALALDRELLDPAPWSLEDPLHALHAVNRDLEFRRRLTLLDGTRLTAIELQRRFLDGLAGVRGALPSWSGPLLQAWHSMLDGLEARDERLYRMVDWLLYWRLWATLANECGIDPAEVGHPLTTIFPSGSTPLDSESEIDGEIQDEVTREYGFDHDLLAELLDRAIAGFRNGNPAPAPDAVVSEAMSLARPRCRRAPDVAIVDERQRRLCAAARELHVRLHALSDSSPLVDLAAAGWIEKTLPGLDEKSIEQAMVSPPAGRPTHRARLVRRLRGSRWRVSWDAIHDTERERCAEIPSEPGRLGHLRWLPESLGGRFRREQPEAVEKLLVAISQHSAPDDFDLCFRAGDYVEAIHLAAARKEEIQYDPGTLHLCHARLGHASGAERELAASLGKSAAPIERLVGSLFGESAMGLAPPAESCASLLAECEPLVRALPKNPGDTSHHRIIVEHCSGLVQLQQGRPVEAVRILRRLIRDYGRQWRPRMYSRTVCLLAEAHRRNRDPEAARRELLFAAQIHLAENLLGDTVDHLLPVLAKISVPEEADRLLRVAEEADRRRGHELALCRILCLRARLLHEAGLLPEIRSLARSVETLRSCPLMARIQSRWKSWVSGKRTAGEDEFWGL